MPRVWRRSSRRITSRRSSEKIKEKGGVISKNVFSVLFNEPLFFILNVAVLFCFLLLVGVKFTFSFSRFCQRSRKKCDFQFCLLNAIAGARCVPISLKTNQQTTYFYHFCSFSSAHAFVSVCVVIHNVPKLQLALVPESVCVTSSWYRSSIWLISSLNICKYTCVLFNIRVRR